MKIIILVLISVFILMPPPQTYAQTNQRFKAPDINQAHKNFLNRTNRNLLNIDFIIANALGEIKSAINDGEQVVQDGVQDITGSVVVQPGADADNVTIININEGDVTAISR